MRAASREMLGGLICQALASRAIYTAAKLIDKKRLSLFRWEIAIFWHCYGELTETDSCAVPIQAVPQHPPVRGTCVHGTQGEHLWADLGGAASSDGVLL